MIRSSSPRLFFACCLLMLALFIPRAAAVGQSADDVTLIGVNQAVYSLPEAQKTSVTTADGQKVTLEINDAIVDANRVLVRVLIWDLPVEFSAKVADTGRVYGSYLPTAELGLPSEKWLTPSSASRYSLISNGNTLVVAGLLEFLTEEQPKIVSFNFNQIPFDEEPLAEGAVVILNLSAGDAQERTAAGALSDTKQNVTFSLINTAQTPELTMFQPGITLSGADNFLAGIGWVHLERQDGKRLLLTRTDAYGINLADDDNVVLQNAYLTSGINDSEALWITLDSITIRRQHGGTVHLNFNQPLAEGATGVLAVSVPLDEFQAEITSYQVFFAAETEQEHPHDSAILRLFLTADPRLTKIGFTANDDATASACGFLPDTETFACDVQLPRFGDAALDLRFDAFEYRVDGDWSIAWQPAALTRFSTPAEITLSPLDYDFSELNQTADPELVAVIDQLAAMTTSLTREPGWIYEKKETVTAIADADHPALISAASRMSQPTRTTLETWDQVDANGKVINNISLTKDREGNLISGTWNQPTRQILLPHGLLVSEKTASPALIYPYVYGSDFYALIGTSVRYLKHSDCGDADQPAQCYLFQASLLTQPTDEVSAYTTQYQVRIDPDSGKIRSIDVLCQLNPEDMAYSVCVHAETQELRWEKSPSREVQQLMDSLIY